jgi:hypothetical protein
MYVQKPTFSGGNLSLHLFERSGMDFQAPASEALGVAPKNGSVRASKVRDQGVLLQAPPCHLPRL